MVQPSRPSVHTQSKRSTDHRLEHGGLVPGGGDASEDAQVELGDDPTARPALSHGFIQGFVPVDDAGYDDIRALVEPAHRSERTLIACSPASFPASRMHAVRI
jgi:hypothetical protein